MTLIVQTYQKKMERSNISISLRSDIFKSNTMEINTSSYSMAQCRPKLERGISLQFAVKPQRSEVLTAKPKPLDRHIYAKIAAENEYANTFAHCTYANASNFREEGGLEEINECCNTFTDANHVNSRARGPTLPPRNCLEHYYSIPEEAAMHRGIEAIDFNKYADSHFLKTLNKLKSEIHDKFDIIRNEVKKRENMLLNEIEEIRCRYILRLNITESNVNKIIHKMNRRHSSINLTSKENVFNPRNGTSLPEEHHLSFQLGTDFAEKIREIGTITQENLPQYKNMSTPIRYYGKLSNSMGEIEFPMGLSVDQESNIVYVVDQSLTPKVCSVTPEGKVQVFAKNFKQPHGICVRQGRVYITNNDRENQTGEVQVYNTKGRLLGKCRREGKLVEALGVSVDSNGDIYVCEGESNSVQVFDSKFNFKREIPMHENVQPIDIQVTDTELYILADETDTKWCILVFDKQGNYKQDILNEEVQAEFGNVQFFTRDVGGNIILADQTTHCLHVLSKFGDLMVNIGGDELSQLCMPNGVDITRNNNVVTSWIYEDSALRLF